MTNMQYKPGFFCNPAEHILKHDSTDAEYDEVEHYLDYLDLRVLH